MSGINDFKDLKIWQKGVTNPPLIAPQYNGSAEIAHNVTSSLEFLGAVI